MGNKKWSEIKYEIETSTFGNKISLDASHFVIWANELVSELSPVSYNYKTVVLNSEGIKLDMYASEILGFRLPDDFVTEYLVSAQPPMNSPTKALRFSKKGLRNLNDNNTFVSSRDQLYYIMEGNEQTTIASPSTPQTHRFTIPTTLGTILKLQVDRDGNPYVLTDVVSGVQKIVKLSKPNKNRVTTPLTIVKEFEVTNPTGMATNMKAENFDVVKRSSIINPNSFLVFYGDSTLTNNKDVYLLLYDKDTDAFLRHRLVTDSYVAPFKQLELEGKVYNTSGTSHSLIVEHEKKQLISFEIEQFDIPDDVIINTIPLADYLSVELNLHFWKIDTSSTTTIVTFLKESPAGSIIKQVYGLSLGNGVLEATLQDTSTVDKDLFNNKDTTLFGTKDQISLENDRASSTNVLQLITNGTSVELKQSIPIKVLQLSYLGGVYNRPIWLTYGHKPELLSLIGQNLEDVTWPFDDAYYTIAKHYVLFRYHSNNTGGDYEQKKQECYQLYNLAKQDWLKNSVTRKKYNLMTTISIGGGN